MLPLLVLLGTIAGAWYLLIVRPQQDQQTRHGAVIAQLKLGDHVLTVGGIYGRIVAIEGPTVVVELAPGLTSRIASDGIARIVQGPEAALPPPSPPPEPARDATPQHSHTHAPTMDHSMQQPTHPEYQQPLVAHDGQGTTTLRAHVLPPAPTLAKPWRDVAPTMTQQVHAPAPVQQPYLEYQQQAMPQGGPVLPQGGPVMQQAAPTYAPQLHAPPPPPQAQWAPAPVAARPDFLPPPPVLQPFAAVRIAPQAPQQGQPLHQVAPTTQQAFHAQVAPQAAPIVTQPAHVVPAPRLFAQATPVAVPGAVQPHAHMTELPHEAPAPAPTRRASQAPKGMGSNLRLDDPSLRDTMERARAEREGLAAEYRQLVAPLVDTSEPAPVAPAAPQQYPGPTRMIVAEASHDHGMPRPHVVAPSAVVDPALQGAFQHRTPYGVSAAVDQTTVLPVAHA